MSTPTGPDPNYPQAGAPEAQPGWAAPETPAQSYNAPAPNYDPPSQGYSPAPSYSGAPAGYGAATGQRPPQVLVAAILGFVVALFLLIGALGFLAFSSLGFFAGLAVIFGIIFLALAGLNIWGGILAIQGKGSMVLLVAGAITAVFSLISLIGSFGFTNLVALIIGVATVFLLLQPQSKQYFAARGRR